MLIPVEGHKNLYRDENSGAIINCDSSEYNQYMSLKKEKVKQKEEIETLKNDVNQIKLLLKQIVDRLPQ